VTELGVDAAAWQTHSFNSFHYALQEVRMYQELLLSARPQGTMQWEFTNDYSIVNEEKLPDGTVKLTPTVRFWFVKHFCNLTPPQCDVLTTTSDQPKVLFTAFAGRDGNLPVYTLHVANFGAQRQATITGLWDGIASWRAVRTSETGAFQELPPVVPKDGTVELELVPQSLLTLTTMK